MMARHIPFLFFDWHKETLQTYPNRTHTLCLNHQNLPVPLIPRLYCPFSFPVTSVTPLSPITPLL